MHVGITIRKELAHIGQRTLELVKQIAVRAFEASQRLQAAHRTATHRPIAIRFTLHAPIGMDHHQHECQHFFMRLRQRDDSCYQTPPFLPTGVLKTYDCVVRKHQFVVRIHPFPQKVLPCCARDSLRESPSQAHTPPPITRCHLAKVVNAIQGVSGLRQQKIWPKKTCSPLSPTIAL